MNTLARIKRAGKNFEIIVNLDNALRFKKGESDFIEAEVERIFNDSKKGLVASSSDLNVAFGTNDVTEIVKKIVKDGEVQVTQEHRDVEQDQKYKQVVDFLVRNAIDPQSDRPHTPERIKNALVQAKVNVKNVALDKQINEIMEALSKVIPIRIEMKRIKITIPAIYTGKSFGLITQYKGEEKWLDDGSLQVLVKIPAGIIMDFYDKLNSITHGSALTQEVKE